MYFLIFCILAVVIYINFPRRQKSIRGKTVLITGGGSGIGRLMAINFAKEGCSKIVLWDLNSKGLESVSQEVKSAGGDVYTYLCDVSNREMVYKIAEQVKKEVGKIDILVNNAGIVAGDFFHLNKDESMEKVIKVNVFGVMWCTKAFLPDMMKENSGHIVTLSSAAATSGVTKLADYAASKWAAFGFAESVRFELQKLKLYGVGTTIVCPYYINTGMFDGVKSFSFLLPIQDQHYVAKEIVRAVKTNRKELYLPRFLVIAYVARLLPVVLRDWLDEHIFKISCSMDEFKGQRRV